MNRPIHTFTFQIAATQSGMQDRAELKAMAREAAIQWKAKLPPEFTKITVVELDDGFMFMAEKQD